MSKNFFEQVQQQLNSILQQLSCVDCSHEERENLVSKAQAFLTVLQNEFSNTQQQLHSMMLQFNQAQSEMKRMQSVTPEQPTLKFYKLIQEAGGDADLVCRVTQKAGVNLIEQLKILRALFGYSLDEARVVEANNQQKL